MTSSNTPVARHLENVPVPHQQVGVVLIGKLGKPRQCLWWQLG